MESWRENLISNVQLLTPNTKYQIPNTQEETRLNHMERVQVNDPDALCRMGLHERKEIMRAHLNIG
eukprot:scaffold23995_cov169-Skeletonema_dohrnii-CCMP3373.AAC.1